MKIILVSSADWLSGRQGFRAAAEFARADILMWPVTEYETDILDTRTGQTQRLAEDLWTTLTAYSADDQAAALTVAMELLPLTSTAAYAARIAGELPDSMVENCALAVDPAWIEDQLWESEDEQHLFLNLELDFVDTILVTSPAAWSLDGPARQRGLSLVETLAPHAQLVNCPAEGQRTQGTPSFGVHLLSQALSRRTLAHQSRISQSGHFTTVEFSHHLPLSADTFYRVLPEVAAGCVRIRGQLWLDSHLRGCLHIQGCGPQVWVENRGAWNPEDELAHTRISFSGEHLDAEWISTLLQADQQFAHLTQEGGMW